MKPLIILIIVFAVSLVISKLFYGGYNFSLSGKIAMSAMLLFTAIGHFAYTKGMTMMLPGLVPYKTELVYLTGLMEIAAGVALLFPAISMVTGWLLIVFFVLLLPANIYAAFNHINYQKGTLDGSGLNYLWFRVPLQILFILWVYFSAIKR